MTSSMYLPDNTMFSLNWLLSEKMCCSSHSPKNTQHHMFINEWKHVNHHDNEQSDDVTDPAPRAEGQHWAHGAFRDTDTLLDIQALRVQQLETHRKSFTCWKTKSKWAVLHVLQDALWLVTVRGWGGGVRAEEVAVTQLTSAQGSCRRWCLRPPDFSPCPPAGWHHPPPSEQAPPPRNPDGPRWRCQRLRPPPLCPLHLRHRPGSDVTGALSFVRQDILHLSVSTRLSVCLYLSLRLCTHLSVCTCLRVRVCVRTCPSLLKPQSCQDFSELVALAEVRQFDVDACS